MIQGDHAGNLALRKAASEIAPNLITLGVVLVAVVLLSHGSLSWLGKVAAILYALLFVVDAGRLLFTLGAGTLLFFTTGETRSLKLWAATAIQTVEAGVIALYTYVLLRLYFL